MEIQKEILLKYVMTLTTQVVQLVLQIACRWTQDGAAKGVQVLQMTFVCQFMVTGLLLEVRNVMTTTLKTMMDVPQ